MSLPRREGWSYVLLHAGREIPISDGDVVLGRGHSAGIRIDEETVSRSHALLSLREGRAIIRDLGSSNGLFVNERRVAGQAPVPDGGTIGLGSAVLSLAIIPPADLEVRTAMIATMPPAAPRSRPSETVTRFMTDGDRSAQRPVDLPLDGPARRGRSADDVIIRPDEEAQEIEARIEAFDPAPIGARLLSALIDMVVSLTIAFVCFVPALVAIVTRASVREKTGAGFAFWALLAFCSAAGIAAVIVYFLSGWCGRGATVGQRAAGIRLISEGGGLITGGRALLRLATVILYFATAGLLAISVLLDRDRRGLADRIAGSRVVSA